MRSPDGLGLDGHEFKRGKGDLQTFEPIQTLLASLGGNAATSRRASARLGNRRFGGFVKMMFVKMMLKKLRRRDGNWTRLLSEK
jgi:hypothetical protein